MIWWVQFNLQFKACRYQLYYQCNGNLVPKFIIDKRTFVWCCEKSQELLSGVWLVSDWEQRAMRDRRMEWGAASQCWDQAQGWGRWEMVWWWGQGGHYLSSWPKNANMRKEILMNLSLLSNHQSFKINKIKLLFLKYWQYAALSVSRDLRQMPHWELFILFNKNEKYKN